jgi:hypothetical protein
LLLLLLVVVVVVVLGSGVLVARGLLMQSVTSSGVTAGVCAPTRPRVHRAKLNAAPESQLVVVMADVFLTGTLLAPVAPAAVVTSG